MNVEKFKKTSLNKKLIKNFFLPLSSIYKTKSQTHFYYARMNYVLHVFQKVFRL